jgi:hypothetical protein
MVYMYSPLFSTILWYCVQGWCTWILHYSVLLSGIVYKDDVHIKVLIQAAPYTCSLYRPPFTGCL